ncbi:hypothetical protein HY256_05920, partial [Candidatus Sumerlaeota bacterium]|nr:hypothetical protein [Candidatus Sumerlaeota bacterium]
MILPPELSLAVEEEAARIQPRDLADAARDLSQAYRGESLAPRFRTHVHRVAYCVTRMSATYAAVHTALANILPSRADPPIHTVLDLGAGPGTASWAACELIPSPARINLIERDGLMANLGKRLALGAPYAPLQDAGWIVDEFADQAELPQSDLVILSYSLGEVEEARRLGIAAKAWSAARWGLLLVEPGTP